MAVANWHPVIPAKMNIWGIILLGYLVVSLIAEIVVLVDFGFRKFKTREEKIFWQKKLFSFHMPFHAISIIVSYYKIFLRKGS